MTEEAKSLKHFRAFLNWNFPNFGIGLNKLQCSKKPIIHIEG